tara:strand:+ start:139 stop:756 length:618 start_codon:yes stop_codon:yes gene_type:complete
MSMVAHDDEMSTYTSSDNVSSVSTAKETYNLNNCIFFYGHSTGDHRYMSNFYPSNITITHACIDGVGSTLFKYPTAEHAIMHMKACLMEDQEVADEIMGTNPKTPLAAKRLGRKVCKSDHTPGWDECKWKLYVGSIAKAVLTAKFEQNPALAQKLKATGSNVLAEAAPRDKIWGIGMGAKTAMTGAAWKGQNLLGKTLMAVRDSI